MLELRLGRAEELLPTLEDESIRLLLTDQPYEVSRETNFDTMGRSGMDFGDWDHTFDPEPYLRAAYPKLMRGGSVVVFNDIWKMGELKALMERLGYVVKRKVYWFKSNPAPFNCGRLIVTGVEEGLWAVKPKGKWVLNRRWGRLEDGVYRYPAPPRKRGRDHPCKKPDLLFADLISLLSDPGELVVDPFAGQGTCLAAAKMTGRRCISFELDAKWEAAARKHAGLAPAPCRVVPRKDNRVVRAMMELVNP